MRDTTPVPATTCFVHTESHAASLLRILGLVPQIMFEYGGRGQQGDPIFLGLYAVQGIQRNPTLSRNYPPLNSHCLGEMVTQFSAVIA